MDAAASSSGQRSGCRCNAHADRLGDRRRIVVEGHVAGAERHVPGVRQQGTCARSLQAVGEQPVVRAPGDRQRRRRELLRRGERVAVERRQRAGEGRRGPRVAQRRDGLLGGQPSGTAERLPQQRRASRARALNASKAGRAARGVRASDTSEAWQKRRSAAVQKPAGEIAVAVATAPRRASSSAIAPPIELPATCGRARCSRRRSARRRPRTRRSSVRLRRTAAATGRSRASRTRSPRSPAPASRSPAARSASAGRSRGSVRAVRRRPRGGG